MVVLGFQFFQEVEGTVAVFLLASVSAVGKEDGHYGIDDQQIERERGDVLLVLDALAAKGVVRLPIFGYRGGEHLLSLLHRGGFQELAEACTAMIIEVGQLRDADMRKVLGAQAEESPQLVIHRLHRELMGQIEVFVSQAREVAIIECILLIAFGDGMELQEPCLTQEDGLHLEEVVTVMIHGSERQIHSPLLEGIAIDAETVVACQGDEVSVLPVAIAAAHSLLDGFRLLRESLGLQGTHPAVDGELGERWDNLIARGILVDGQQLLIVLIHVVGDGELHLDEALALRVLGIHIQFAAYVEDDVVIAFVLVVAMHIPVARLVVYLHVAHPQGAANLDFGIEEVGACIAIVQARVDDFHLLMDVGGELGEWEELVLPHVMQELFHTPGC